MTTLPPTKDVLDLLRQTALPAAGGAVLVVCLFRLCGRWAGAIGSAAAVAAAFLWANYNFDKPGWDDGRLLPWNPEPSTPERSVPGWSWLPRAAVLLMLVGLLSRWAGLLVERFLPPRRWWAANLLVWAPRAGAVVAVAGWLATGKAAGEVKWLFPALAGATLLGWFVLDGIARAGASVEAAAYLAASLLAAGTVLIYAHSLRFTEIELTIGFALLGVAVAAAATKTDAGGAIPAGVAFLPGLVLAGRPSLAENKVPDISFWLVALAPLTLAPFLIPRLSRQNRWLVMLARAASILTPLAVAVLLAMQHEKLPHEIEDEW